LNFLLIATLTYLLFPWVWNLDYGGQRDGDLFSLAALPMTLLLIALPPRALNRGRLLAGAATPPILGPGHVYGTLDLPEHAPLGMAEVMDRGSGGWRSAPTL